jgi:hypothetical protein
MCFTRDIHWQYIVIVGLILTGITQASLGQQEIDPDSITYSPLAVGSFNPYRTLCCMYSSEPVLDHNGEPHRDGHVIQIIADGGNGIQDLPNFDGSPGGDDSLAAGNFNIQYVNGEKHSTEGLGSGMFIGMAYFISYKLNQTIYLRVWEGPDPSAASFYQDSKEYTTTLGNSGGCMITLRTQYSDEIDWRFGRSMAVTADE